MSTPSPATPQREPSVGPQAAAVCDPTSASAQELRTQVDAALVTLSARLGGPRLLARCSSRDGWPEHGVFLLAEPGEHVTDGRAPRITAIGTHGREPDSPVLLWTRLAQHRGSVAGPNPGAGNHRGSWLRRLVGEALLARDATHAEAAATWGQGERADRTARRSEAALERAVSAHIGAMSVLWLGVHDREERIRIVAGLVALLSHRGGAVGVPPPVTWLGHHAPRTEVRRSGLWHVDGTDAPIEVAAVHRFLAHVEAG